MPKSTLITHGTPDRGKPLRTCQVAGYTRNVFPVRDPEYRRDDCWNAINRLCENANRYGFDAIDRRNARNAIKMLERTFLDKRRRSPSSVWHGSQS